MPISRPFLPFWGIFQPPEIFENKPHFFTKPLTIPPQTLDTIDIIDTIGTIKTIYSIKQKIKNYIKSIDIIKSLQHLLQLCVTI